MTLVSTGSGPHALRGWGKRFVRIINMLESCSCKLNILAIWAKAARLFLLENLSAKIGARQMGHRRSWGRCASRTAARSASCASAICCSARAGSPTVSHLRELSARNIHSPYTE